MGNYVTATEVRAYKVRGATVDLTAYTDAELEIEIDIAEEMIDIILNDWFNARAVTEFYDGNGLVNLFYSPGTPARCISITTLEEVDTDGITVTRTYVEDTDFKVYDYYVGLLNKSRGESARLRSFGGGIFPLGERNIKLVGSFGRATTPPAIDKAVKLLVLENLSPGSSGMSPRDVTQAVWNDFTITFRAGEAGAGMSTGFAEVDRLLQPHINYADMFQVTTPFATPHDRR